MATTGCVRRTVKIMIDLSQLTEAYIKNYRRRLKSPADINKGDCFRFAYLAHKIFGGQLISVTVHVEFFTEEFEPDGSHAFLKIDNKYYDSESVLGVDDWQRLAYFKDADEAPFDFFYEVKIHRSALSFRRYWAFNKAKVRADEKLLYMMYSNNIV